MQGHLGSTVLPVGFCLPQKSRDSGTSGRARFDHRPLNSGFTVYVQVMPLPTANEIVIARQTQMRF